MTEEKIALTIEKLTELRTYFLSYKAHQDLTRDLLDYDLRALMDQFLDACIAFEDDEAGCLLLLDIGFKLLHITLLSDVRENAIGMIELIHVSSASQRSEALQKRLWAVIARITQFRTDKYPEFVEKAHALLITMLSSSNIPLRDKVTRFYCDRKSNEAHNIYTFSKETLDPKTFLVLEANMRALIVKGHASYGCTFAENEKFTTKDMCQAYFDCFIYGELGLENSDCSKEEKALFFDALSEFGQTRSIGETITKENKYLQDYFDYLETLAGKAIIKFATQFEQQVKSKLQDPTFSYDKPELAQIIYDTDDFIKRVTPLSTKRFGKTLTKITVHLTQLKADCEVLL